MTEEQAWQIIDLLTTTQDAAISLIKNCEDGDSGSFITLSDDIVAAYKFIMSFVEAHNNRKSYYIACESVVESLNHILAYDLSDASKRIHKIEFELLPLMQSLYMFFYFYEIIAKDKERFMHYIDKQRYLIGVNSYVDYSEKAGEYKYELSIIVTGFNKLEYTKMCIDNLLKYIPKNLSYELILINHGSTDGTKEFFESIRPHKQLDIFRNGGGYGAVQKIIEGRYTLSISNDVLVTENAITNLLSCIKSDSKIAYVVPTTPNVSNLQSITTERFETLDEMYIFAKENNQKNPLKWEQRVRLCNPIALYSSKHILSSSGIQYQTYIISEDGHLFPDDKRSLLFRKHGLKMMLAKDAYCYHFGSVTLKDTIKENEYYTNGRKIFKQTFNIDPWGKGFCYDPHLFHELNLSKKDKAYILGISPGIGSNPLKIKTMLRELGSENTKLFLATEEEHFKVDYETYTEPEYVTISRPNEFASVFPKEFFDYITVEFPINSNMLNSLIKRLKPKGQLLVLVSDEKTIRSLNKRKPNQIIDSKSHGWFVYNKN